MLDSSREKINRLSATHSTIFTSDSDLFRAFSLQIRSAEPTEPIYSGILTILRSSEGLCLVRFGTWKWVVGVRRELYSSFGRAIFLEQIPAPPDFLLSAPLFNKA